MKMEEEMLEPRLSHPRQSYKARTNREQPSKPTEMTGRTGILFLSHGRQGWIFFYHHRLRFARLKETSDNWSSNALTYSHTNDFNAWLAYRTTNKAEMALLPIETATVLNWRRREASDAWIYHVHCRDGSLDWYNPTPRHRLPFKREIYDALSHLHDATLDSGDSAP